MHVHESRVEVEVEVWVWEAGRQAHDGARYSGACTMSLFGVGPGWRM